MIESMLLIIIYFGFWYFFYLVGLLIGRAFLRVFDYIVFKI
jgi:hypothetical protein